MGGVREWYVLFDVLESVLMCTGLERGFELVELFDSLELSESLEFLAVLLVPVEYLRELGSNDRLYATS